MKQVFMISSNKGGVGKSVTAEVLISMLALRGHTVSVLDGDGRTPDIFGTCHRKIPARVVDFRNLRPDRYDNLEDGEYEELIHTLLKTGSDLVINTPDGADDLLLKWFDTTLQYTEDEGVRFKLMYVINDKPDGLDIMPDLIKRFAFLYPIRNRYFGEDHAFVDFNAHHAHFFHYVAHLPVLRKREWNQITRARNLPHEHMLACNPDGTYQASILSRQRISNWINDSLDVFDDILSSDVGNIKVISPTQAMTFDDGLL